MKTIVVTSFKHRSKRRFEDMATRRVPSLTDLLRPYSLTARRLLRRDLRLSDLGYARRISYSQFGEDLWLADHFADQVSGFFVDVGAYDPFNASNTLLLYRKGWRGINLEPEPEALRRFERFRGRDVNLGIAISSHDGDAAFVRAGSFSGLDDPDRFCPDARSDRIVVRTRRLQDVLDEYRPVGDIDLLDVDVEGHDLVVLHSNDWERFRPRIVLVEHHPGAPGDARPFFSDVGYRLIRKFNLTYAFERTD
jgi:FkbM family methyltransferase